MWAESPSVSRYGGWALSFGIAGELASATGDAHFQEGSRQMSIERRTFLRVSIAVAGGLVAAGPFQGFVAEQGA